MGTATGTAWVGGGAIRCGVGALPWRIQGKRWVGAPFFALLWQQLVLFCPLSLPPPTLPRPAVQQDYREAVRWYRRAAEQAHPKVSHVCFIILFPEASYHPSDIVTCLPPCKATFNLGACYLSGHGVPASEQEAAKYAAKHMHPSPPHTHTPLSNPSPLSVSPF